jgi:transposase-like protein
VDETYIKVKGEWKYLYRAVDSEGNTIDFLLRAKRDARAAERFFRKALRAVHTTQPRVINVDQNAVYPPAFEALQQDGAGTRGYPPGISTWGCSSKRSSRRAVSGSSEKKPRGLAGDRPSFSKCSISSEKAIP